MIDITPIQLDEIKKLLSALPPKGYSVYAFGSRVKSQARPYSDLDLLIEGPAPLPKSELYLLEEAFAESDLPFRVDISDSARVSDSFKNCIQSELVRII